MHPRAMREFERRKFHIFIIDTLACLGRLTSANAGEERRDALFEHLARDLESRFARNYITFLSETNLYHLRGMGKSDWGVDEDAEEKLGMFPSMLREALEEDEEKEALGILNRGKRGRED